MKIGIALPNNWGIDDPNELVDLAVRAQKRGFASVWTGKHLVNVAYVRERIGDRPYHHCLAVLSSMGEARRHH